MARTPDGKHTFEIINLPVLPEEGYLQNVQLAVDGVPCWPFHVSASDRARYTNQDDFVLMLVRQAQTLIEVYGDVRRAGEFNSFLGKPMRELAGAA